MFRKFLFLLFLLFFSLNSFAEKLIIEPDAGRAPFLNAIQNASTSIGMVMYGLTDESFIDALTRAKDHGKNVTILLEPAPYKSENENNRAIRQLRDENINLEWPDKSFKLVHQKTFIFDQQKVIVMTFNLTHSSFKQERNFALVLTDPAEIQEIVKVFHADCAHEDTDVSNPHLIWSPDNSREKIISFIQSAKSEIKIYAQDVTDYKIIGELAKAARSGVEVKILLSASPEKLHSRKFAFLKKSGVIIQSSRHYYIHAKVMIVDQRQAILGSINFTAPSLDSNRELSVLTEDANVVNQLNSTFENDWHDTQSLVKWKSEMRPMMRLLRQIKYFYRGD